MAEWKLVRGGDDPWKRSLLTEDHLFWQAAVTKVRHATDYKWDAPEILGPLGSTR